MGMDGYYCLLEWLFNYFFYWTDCTSSPDPHEEVTKVLLGRDEANQESGLFEIWLSKA